MKELEPENLLYDHFDAEKLGIKLANAKKRLQTTDRQEFIDIVACRYEPIRPNFHLLLKDLMVLIVKD